MSECYRLVLSETIESLNYANIRRTDIEFVTEEEIVSALKSAKLSPKKLSTAGGSLPLKDSTKRHLNDTARRAPNRKAKVPTVLHFDRINTTSIANAENFEPKMNALKSTRRGLSDDLEGKGAAVVAYGELTNEAKVDNIAEIFDRNTKKQLERLEVLQGGSIGKAVQAVQAVTANMSTVANVFAEQLHGFTSNSYSARNDEV